MARSKRSEKTDLLIEFLADCYTEGKLAEHAQMTDLIGLDTIIEGRHYLEAAKRYLRREKKIHFQSVHGIGYMPVRSEAVVKWINESRNQQIHRKASLYSKDLSNIAMAANLTPKQVHQISVGKAISAHVLDVTNPERIKQLNDGKGEAVTIKLSLPPGIDEFNQISGKK
jgi:hypothetical protein